MPNSTLRLTRILAESHTKETDDSVTYTKTGLSPLNIPADWLDYYTPGMGETMSEPVLEMATSTGDGPLGRFKRRVWKFILGILG